MGSGVYILHSPTIMKQQRGAVLTWVIVTLPFMLLCLAVVVDLAHLEIVKGRMQSTADAAALAGAQYLPDEYTARAKALTLCNDNGFSPTKNTITTELSQQYTNGYEVGIARDIPGLIYGKWFTFHPRVVATAIKGPPPCSLVGHLMPFAIINPNINYDSRDNLDPDNWGKRYILLFGEENLLIQDWANGDLPVGDDAPGIDPDYSKNNSEGWRAALRLDLSGFNELGGSDAFVYNFLNGWPGEATVGDILPVLTGNKAGPVGNTRDTRLQDEEDFSFSNFDPNRDYAMARVVHVPIVSLLHEGSTTERYTIEDYYAGADWEHTYVIIDGFAPFYLLTFNEMGDVDGDGVAKDKDWLVGYYIPGTKIPMYSETGCEDYGVVTWARLVE